MSVPETARELFSYLSATTRKVIDVDLARFTTGELSRALSISRNLASHYLNELVRGGLVVKAGSRPVYYFSKRDLERVLQRRLDRASYESPEELLASSTDVHRRDFERAVGHDLSLASAIETLQAAVRYPPCGLPVLICGERGTGKTLLATLMCEWGRNVGALRSDAQAVVVDCVGLAEDHESLAHLLSEDGLIAEARGGIVVLRNVDHLPSAAARLVLGAAAAHEPAARFVFLTTCGEDDIEVAPFAREVPVVVSLPSLRERPTEEREELVLGLLKEEGLRLGADVFISRMAFSCLVDADFKDNVSGLRACITSCCASAYLERVSNRVEIQAFRLPGFVLDATPVADGMPRATHSSTISDVKLIDTTRSLERAGDNRSVRTFSAMLASWRSYEAGNTSVSALVCEVLAQVEDYEDYLVFDVDATSSRATAYERIIAGIVGDASATYGMDLSKKSARVIARCIHAQVHPGTRLAKWRSENQAELAALLALLLDTSDFCRRAAEFVTSQTEGALGLKLDVLSRILIFAEVRGADRREGRRRSVGIVLAHGYSTATSIADAANRILRRHVFEAIDMSYDQEVSDIVGPLRDLLDRYAFCDEIALLVDMGSLEHVLEEVGELTNVTLGIVNNASTGMALEVGSALMADEPLSTLLPAVTEACASRWRILEGRVLEQAVLFCSEGGPQAAERIRSLIERSIEVELPLRFVVCSPQQLRREGLTERYDVLAVIGTDDPGLAGTPFIALEDVISGVGAIGVDDLFAPYLDERELERFHQNLVKNLTLRNVIESITILNPEKVLEEVERAVESLQHLMGSNFGPNITIGLCVHLCCLIERLVTHNPIETYADVESFEGRHSDFVWMFRQCFSDISRHYGVEVPVAEIAYAFDFVSGTTRRTTRREKK